MLLSGGMGEEEQDESGLILSRDTESLGVCCGSTAW